MMRVPSFRYHAPTSVAEAAALLAEDPKAKLLAGGTDIIPNMKRRQQVPATLISLKHVAELRQVTADSDGNLTLGACLTLNQIANHPQISPGQRAVKVAAGKVATPHIQNMGTLGGNLCLDTRCNYYNQNHDWRQAIDYCKKAPGPEGVALKTVGETTQVCWVATGSPRCWAVSSTDTAPALVALGAEVTLVSKDGERRIPLTELYNDDGMNFLTKRDDEILTAVHVPAHGEGWKSTYWKLRRRGSFDFPVLGVGAALRLSDGNVVEEARVALGAVASYPVPIDTSSLIGKALDDEAIAAFAKVAAKKSKPLDNTDYHLSWRKAVTQRFVTGALRELRGDAPDLLSRTAARVALLPTV